MTAISIGIIQTQGRKTLAATIKALRRDHDLADVELLVAGKANTKQTRSWVEDQPGIRLISFDPDSSPGALDQLFAEATGDRVLVLEAGVRLRPGAVRALQAFDTAHPDSRDLLHGPLMDGKRLLATHSNPFWRGRSWGERARDPRGVQPGGAPFVIPMQESGVFSCRRDAWPGLPSGWRGYGAEAGYLQERFRRSGAQVLCLPALRWERAKRPDEVPPHTSAARALLRNHIVGAADLDLDTSYITQRYRDSLLPGEVSHVRLEVLKENEREAALAAPLVSCLLYASQFVPGQRRVLEEAVESFLRQDYRQKELILLNDTPEQFLICDAPGVRVINTSARCPTLGDCYNVAAAFAQGELLAPWDAASIQLPWRLSKSAEQIGTSEVYRPAGCWYMLDGRLDDRAAQPDGGQVGLITREAFRAVGGYPAVTLGLHREMDAALDAWLAARGQSRPVQTLSQAEWFTIMRRTQRDALYTGDPFLDPWQAAGQRHVRGGEYVLEPHWEEDYVALTLDQLSVSEGDTQQAEPPMPVPFVVGARRGRVKHWLPREDQAADEPPECHLERVAALVAAAVAAGGTHLIIPREEATWLSRHPQVGEYLTTWHWLVEAGPESGFIFALNDEVLSSQAARTEVDGG